MSSNTKSRPQEEKIPGLVPLFLALMLTMLLASLNQTSFSTALPTIVGELNGVNQMNWVITAYILATTIMMPIYGKLGDQLGRKPLIITAISIFMAGSVVGGLASSMPLLIAARAVQGIGGGGLMILSQAAIADVVPARQRGKYMGIMGGVFAFSSVAGPLLGGWLTEGPGWRWIFWINMPLGALALAGVIGFLKLPRHNTGKPRLDVLGMVLISIATACMVLFTTWGGNEYEWSSPIILAMIAATVISGALFVWVESRASEPIMPLHLFGKKNFNLATIAGLFIGIAMFGALGYMPTFIQMVFGMNASVAGLMMIPMMACLLITSTLAGQWVSRTGRYKWYPVIGTIITGLSLILMGTMDADQAVWIVCVYLGILGIGLGLSMQILVLIVQNTFPITEVGTATATNNYFRQIGASMGSALVGSIFASRLANMLADNVSADATQEMGGADSLTPELVDQLPAAIHDPVIESYTDALVPIYLWIAPLAFLAAILVVFIKETPLATSNKPTEEDDDAQSSGQEEPTGDFVSLETGSLFTVGDSTRTRDISTGSISRVHEHDTKDDTVTSADQNPTEGNDRDNRGQ